MGFETIFESNPENTLYAWMQKVFPDYAAWVQEQLDKPDEQMGLYLKPRAVEIVKALNGFLPAEAEFRQRFSHEDAEVLLESMYSTFDEATRLSATENWHLKEIAYFRKSLMYQHFSMLHRVFESAFHLPRIAYLLGAYGGRIFSDSEESCDKSIDLPMMYWSYEECLEIRQALSALIDQAHPLFQEHETRIKHWYLVDEEMNHEDPDIEITEIREISQRLDSGLAPLQVGEGVVVSFSY